MIFPTKNRGYSLAFKMKRNTEIAPQLRWPRRRLNFQTMSVMSRAKSRQNILQYSWIAATLLKQNRIVYLLMKSLYRNSLFAIRTYTYGGSTEKKVV